MLFAEVNKRINAKTAVSFADGLAQVKSEMPELYASVAEGYAPPPQDLDN